VRVQKNYVLWKWPLIVEMPSTGCTMPLRNLPGLTAEPLEYFVETHRVGFDGSANRNNNLLQPLRGPAQASLWGNTVLLPTCLGAAPTTTAIVPQAVAVLARISGP
jgi:hypothetical protein